MEFLQQKGIKVNDEVVQLMEKQDEFLNEQGRPTQCKAEAIPTEIRAFSLVNSFEHFLQEAPQTEGTVTKIKTAMDKIETNKERFDSDLLGCFRVFIFTLNIGL